MLRIAKLLLLILFLAPLPGLAAPQRVALLRTAEGSVMVAGQPAKKFQALHVGDKVTLSKGATMKVDFLKSGLRQTVSGPAELKVTPTGLEGKGSIKNDPASQMAALPDIGAQKKIGGARSRTRAVPEHDLTIQVEQTASGLQFKVLRWGYAGEYYLAIQSDDLDFKPWDQESLSAPEFSLPQSVFSRLKPGVTYTVIVGKPDQVRDYKGHELRFQPLDPADYASLLELRRSLTDEAVQDKNPEPLIVLMELLNEKDMVLAAAEAGRQALTLGGPKLEGPRRQLVAEAVERLYLELDDPAEAGQIRTTYLEP